MNLNRGPLCTAKFHLDDFSFITDKPLKSLIDFVLKYVCSPMLSCFHGRFESVGNVSRLKITMKQIIKLLILAINLYAVFWIVRFTQFRAYPSNDVMCGRPQCRHVPVPIYWFLMPLSNNFRAVVCTEKRKIPASFYLVLVIAMATIVTRWLKL